MWRSKFHLRLVVRGALSKHVVAETSAKSRQTVLFLGEFHLMRASELLFMNFLGSCQLFPLSVLQRNPIKGP